MVSLASLWLPILLSAVVAWIASAIFWTVSPHHKTDFKTVPDQDDFLDAVKKRDLSPGQYWFPYSDVPAERTSPEMVEKMTDNPNGMLTVISHGAPNMGKNLVLSFLVNLVIAVFVGYVAAQAFGVGEPYMNVFQLTSVVAFMGYGFGYWHEAIWFGQPWKRAWKTVFDALVYGLLTAGVFGWLWP